MRVLSNSNKNEINLPMSDFNKKEEPNAANSSAESPGPSQEFITALQELYCAEMKKLKFLPALEHLAEHEDLRDAFRDHLLILDQHIARLAEVFRITATPPAEKECDEVDTIVQQGLRVSKEVPERSVFRDLKYITAAQSYQKYELSAYRKLAELAPEAGYPEAAELFTPGIFECEETILDLADISKWIEDDVATGEPQ
ncbi:MAG: DUF892 family protein [Chryseobacterium sp.]|nr:MAG: DUF892 family protein [Chryseobacterium sp.]